MSTKKHSAFLMCPTSCTAHTQLGGTPRESGEAGGHIKKETWEHAFAAALRGLPKAVSGDQAIHLGAPQRLKGFVGQAQIDRVVHEVDEGAHVVVTLPAGHVNHLFDRGLASRQRGAIEAVKIADKLRSLDALGETALECRVYVGLGQREAHGSGPLLLCGAALGLTLAECMQERLGLPTADLMGMSTAELADRRQLDAGSNANLADLGPRHGSEGFPEGLKVELIIHLRIVYPFTDNSQALNVPFYG